MIVTLLTACSGSSEPEPLLCNGRADLCDRRLDQVVLAVAHNAMNVEDEDWGIPNQHFGYERQVEDGIRGFMLDIYDQDGVATLCHGSCSLGSEPLWSGATGLACSLIRPGNSCATGRPCSPAPSPTSPPRSR